MPPVAFAVQGWDGASTTNIPSLQRDRPVVWREATRRRRFVLRLAQPCVVRQVLFRNAGTGMITVLSAHAETPYEVWPALVPCTQLILNHVGVTTAVAQKDGARPRSIQVRRTLPATQTLVLELDALYDGPPVVGLAWFDVIGDPPGDGADRAFPIVSHEKLFTLPAPLPITQLKLGWFNDPA